jgi:methionine biosynthesis protein MetW
VEDDLIEQMYRRHHREGGRLGQSFIEQKRAHLFTPWIGKGKDVLDLGCRDGTLTRHFVEGNRVVGADIDSEALEFAKREYGIEVQWVNLNSVLPFPDERFDVVIMAETLEHLPYPTITLAEVRRVLRPSGIFIGNVPLFYHLHNRWQILRGKRPDWDPTHLQYFSYDSLRELLQDFFTIEEMVVLKGERWAKYSMLLFARNVAFLCRKPYR